MTSYTISNLEQYQVAIWDGFKHDPHKDDAIEGVFLRKPVHWPRTIKEFSFDGMIQSILKPVSKNARALYEQLKDKEHGLFYISGSPGVGKTSLAYILALIQQNKHNKTTVKDISNWNFENFKTTSCVINDQMVKALSIMIEKDGNKELKQKLIDVKCLVIDDLGRSNLTPNVTSIVHDILDRRKLDKLTIVTSNFDLNILLAKLPDLAARLEHAQLFKITGKNMRAPNPEENKDKWTYKVKFNFNTVTDSARNDDRIVQNNPAKVRVTEKMFIKAGLFHEEEDYLQDLIDSGIVAELNSIPDDEWAKIDDISTAINLKFDGINLKNCHQREAIQFYWESLNGCALNIQ